MRKPDVDRVRAAITRHRGVVLDANLLVLYVAARVGPHAVARIRATKGFADRDALYVAAIVETAGQLATTPHVLAEVNGLLRNGTPGRLRYAVLEALSWAIGRTEEVSVSSREATLDPSFQALGLVDSALLKLAPDWLIVSMDGPLCNEIISRGLEVLYYPPRVSKR